MSEPNRKAPNWPRRQRRDQAVSKRSFHARQRLQIELQPGRRRPTCHFGVHTLAMLLRNAIGRSGLPPLGVGARFLIHRFTQTAIALRQATSLIESGIAECGYQPREVRLLSALIRQEVARLSTSSPSQPSTGDQSETEG